MHGGKVRSLGANFSGRRSPLVISRRVPSLPLCSIMRGSPFSRARREESSHTAWLSLSLSLSLSLNAVLSQAAAGNDWALHSPDPRPEPGLGHTPRNTSMDRDANWGCVGVVPEAYCSYPLSASVVETTGEGRVRSVECDDGQRCWLNAVRVTAAALCRHFTGCKQSWPLLFDLPPRLAILWEGDVYSVRER